MVATLVLKDKAKTVSSMEVLKSVLGRETVPELALAKDEIARAGLLASALCWK